MPKNQRLTRPMTDKIKEALYDSLKSLGVEPRRVLDLYAGSGSIGIEALSRGADWCDFVDQDLQAIRAIRRNLEITKFQDRAAVFQRPVNAFIEQIRQPYDFIILDPPYADPAILETVEHLSASAAVEEKTVVVLGHWPRLTVPERVGSLTALRRRCHGDSCFAIFEVGVDVERANGA
jgi:16S rRNA (guanine966-N2)-methyltransferase